MNLRRFFILGALLSSLGAGGGCLVSVDTAPVGDSRGAYESCVSGNICLSGSSCLSAALTLSGTGAAMFCTSSCSTAMDCPDSTFTSDRPPACVVGASGQGQCFDTCVTDADCGTNTRCAVAPTRPPVQVCVPFGEGTPQVVTVARFGRCGEANQFCAAGSTCQGAIVAPGAGALCTSLCNDVSPCADAMTACVGLPSTADGQCLPTCGGGSPCAAGFTCTRANNMQNTPVSVCVPQP